MTLTQVRSDRPVPQTSSIVGGNGAKYRFTVLKDGVVRYEWAPDGEFEDRPSAFAAQRNQTTVPDFRVRESDSSLEIITARFHLTYNKEEFSAHGLSAVVHGYTNHWWRFGENAPNLGGTFRTLDGVDGRVGVEPGVASRDGFAQVDDSDTMLFTADGFVAPRRPGPGRVDGYLFCYGHEYREAVRALYAISGPTPLLPRWTLGNWWSRYYEYSADEYIKLMDTFKDMRIPLTVAVIDMDWHLVDDQRVRDAGVTGWTGYTWNKELFPDSKAFVKELHKRHLKTSLNEHPAEGVAKYEEMYEAMARALKFDTSDGETIAFDITDRTFLKAYFDILIKHLEDDGLDFWWLDWQQGPYSRMKGVDPLWVLNHYHFLHNARLQDGKPGGRSRPIIFSRYAGPGSQRYPVGFSGDTVISWASLHFQPEFTASASNIGYGWWSHDIGGHMFGVRDDDLTARWVQLGVMSPIMRLHSTKMRWVCKEPWKLPPGPQDVVANFLRLRHRLIPYLHTMNARAAAGDPLVQPMYWEYPEREEAYAVPNQYYFGTEVIVAPITTPQNKNLKTGKVKAWLPPGQHVDFFTGVVYTGNRTLWLTRTLDKMPVLLKQGAIVPLDLADAPENGAFNPEGIEIVVAVGADGEFELQEEDNDNDDNDNGGDGWVRTAIKFTQKSGTLEFTSPRNRAYRVRLVGFRESKVEAHVNGRAGSDIRNGDNGLVIDLGTVPSGGHVQVFVGQNPQLGGNDALALADPILFNAEISYVAKLAIDDVLQGSGSNGVKAGAVDALDVDEDIKTLLKELLLADSR